MMRTIASSSTVLTSSWIILIGNCHGSAGRCRTVVNVAQSRQKAFSSGCSRAHGGWREENKLGRMQSREGAPLKAMARTNLVVEGSRVGCVGSATQRYGLRGARRETSHGALSHHALMPPRGVSMTGCRLPPTLAVGPGRRGKGKGWMKQTENSEESKTSMGGPLSALRRMWVIVPCLGVSL